MSASGTAYSRFDGKWVSSNTRLEGVLLFRLKG